MIRALERAFPYLLFVPALSALVFVDGLLYPYLTPKTLLFRGAAILALAVFAALALSGRSFYFERIRHPVSWIPGVLLVWAYICSLFGIDFYHSFWSIFDRGDGLLTLTAVVGFFYLLLLYADDAFMRRLFALIAWTGSLSALFGVLEYLQWASGINFPLLPDGSDRVASTFGNPTFFSSYVALSLFVTLMVARDLKGTWQKWAYVGVFLQFLGILAGGTRGTLLAAIAAGFLCLLYLAWKGERGRVRSYARYGVLALVIAALLGVTFRSQLAQVPFAPVQRLAQISLTDATVESRLFIWRSVVSEALQRPVFGFGAEHISVIFNRFYDPTQILEEWFDRTHNAFLDYLVQYGVPGFLLYLVLIAGFVREAWRLLVSVRDDERYRGLLFSLVAIVYAVQNFFVFDTALTLWLFLTLFTAMLVWRLRSAPRPIVRFKLPQAVPLIVGALVALLVIPVSLLPLRANVLLAEAYLYQLVDARRSVHALERGLRLGTYADMEYGYQVYEWYTERQTTKLGGEERLMAYRAARDILRANYKEYSYDARTAVYFAHVLDVAPPGEDALESELRGVLARAVELSPKRVQSRYLLTNISIRKGDALPPSSPGKKAHYAEAIRLLEEYSALVPTFAEPYYVIATLYQTLGNKAHAKEWADQGISVYKADPNTARRASRYYITAQDWPNAARFLSDLSNADPTNYPVMYDLAKAEFLAGNVERAKEIVALLREKAPGLVETDANFVRALTK